MVLENRRAQCKARYHTLKAQGLCVKCGKTESIQSKTLCVECRTKHNRRASNYYHINKKNF